MEPKIIKEEAIDRDSNALDEHCAVVNNNNNNKESAFRIHTREYKRSIPGPYGLIKIVT